MTLSSPTTARFARINGIDIAFRVQGDGPPLVLIMGYRLSSAAWPAKFVETLAKNFTVITFDNRGTGHSDKPVTGYALANMAATLAAYSTRSASKTHTWSATRWAAQLPRNSSGSFQIALPA